MIKLLLDQGLPRSTASLLTDAGWDVVHTYHIGLEKSSDRIILDFARKEGRTIVTLDADFHALLAVGGDNSPSVIRIRQEGLHGPELAALLQRIWSQIEQQVSDGVMITLTEWAVRIHRFTHLSRRRLTFDKGLLIFFLTSRLRKITPNRLPPVCYSTLRLSDHASLFTSFHKNACRTGVYPPPKTVARGCAPRKS